MYNIVNMHKKLTYKLKKKSKENAVRFTANSVKCNFLLWTKKYMERKAYYNSNISKTGIKLT